MTKYKIKHEGVEYKFSNNDSIRNEIGYAETHIKELKDMLKSEKKYLGKLERLIK